MSTSSTMRHLTAAAVAALVCAGPAGAAITLPGGDTLSNGDFAAFSYGETGSAYVSTLLSVSGLLGVQQPALQVTGTTLDYSYSGPNGLGSPVVRIEYSFTNSGLDPWSDLRFMVNVQPDGDFATFEDIAGWNWPAASPGDPDRRQIGVFVVDPVLSQMQANNGVLDGVDTCGGTCDADFGLEWRRATLAAGETWTIGLTLVDDPTLVIGGRYLSARSAANPTTTHLVVGNPQLVPEPRTYALLLAGLGLLAFMRMRRT
jgi:hypothetical protein